MLSKTCENNIIHSHVLASVIFFPLDAGGKDSTTDTSKIQWSTFMCSSSFSMEEEDALSVISVVHTFTEAPPP